MSTCFDDHMFTCMYAFELICLDSLMITYPYVEMLCMFTCLIDHVLTYVLALTIIFSHVNLLSWSYVSRFTYFDVHMLLYSNDLIITHTSMFTCFDIICPMCICFDENISTCLFVLMLICLNTFLIARSFDHMLLYSYALLITCFYVRMPRW